MHRWQRGEVHDDVERRDKQNREQDCAGNGFLGLADLAAEEGDVVVAPVVVGSDEGGLRESTDGGGCGLRGRRRHMPPSGRRSVRESGDDDARHGSHDTDKQDPCGSGDDAEATIKKHSDEKTGSGSGEVGVVESGQCCDGRAVDAGPEPGEEAGESDAAGGDGERGGETELPDVEEAEPVAGAIGAVDFAEKGVRSAGSRKGRSEFSPDEAVGDGDDGAEDPCPDGEAVSGCGNDEGKGDERAHADHLEHVEEHGRAQADAALEVSGLRVGWIAGGGHERGRMNRGAARIVH